MIDHLEQISPAPPPWAGRAVLRQRWTELAYFHWPYDPEVVQRLLPDGVTTGFEPATLTLATCLRPSFALRHVL